MDVATYNCALQEVLWCSVAAAAAMKLKKKKRRKRWCKEWISRRSERGSFAQIFSELESECPEDFENYTRMPIPAFYNLLTIIGHLEGRAACSRRVVPPLTVWKQLSAGLASPAKCPSARFSVSPA